MGKLATRPKRAPTAPVKSKKGRKPDTVTEEGGPGYSRDAKSELFLLAATNMVSEKTFYEGAKDRDSRFAKLVRKVTNEDPDWVARFVPYLRDSMNMRSASIVMAVELVHQKLTQPVGAGKISNRTIIDSAIKRADEPAEMLGYWMSQYGKNLPMPVKRGVADAVERLYNERSVIKWDSAKNPIRFSDVIELTHPEHKAPWQAELYKYILDVRHDHFNTESNITLRTLLHNRQAMALDQVSFREGFSAQFVEDCGLTWEQASSKYGQLDAHFWESMIPSMGVFALVRNLRNFDDVVISKEAQAQVVAKLTDEETIAKSRMFPLRFFSALMATKTLTYHPALEEAINVSLKNVPVLPGKTLVMCDISRSMEWAISDKSEVKRLAVASIFSAALACRAENPTLVAFTTDSKEIPIRKGQSVLLATKDIVDALPYEGTATWSALKKHFKDHDRVVIVTDEQAEYGSSLFRDHTDKDPSGWLPEDVKLFTYNVAGYRAGHAPSGKRNRYAFGGLSDAAFTSMEMLDRGTDADWPF